MLAKATVAEAVPRGPSSLQLPADFSPEQDVVVLAGTDSAAWLAELERRGIRRVVTFTPNEVPALGGSRAAAHVRDVVAHVLDFVPPARRIRLERLPSGISDDDFASLKKGVELAGVNRATFASAGPVWVRHALANLPGLARSASVECLKGAFAGKPCVLVSPGPSLSKNIDVLARIAENVLIIAGNRALAPLRRAGITPHIVIVADALDLTYQLHEGLLDGVAALVVDLIVHPSVVQLPVERRFFFSAVREIHESTLTGLGQDGFLSAGGSVATVALSLALHVGAGPIAMVGQDLALDGEQYYIPSAPDGDTRIRLSDGMGVFENLSPELRRAMHEGSGAKLDQEAVQHFIQVPGYHGGEVLTSLQFDTYRRWFGGAALDHAEKARILNCTEGGARIDNMPQARLSDFASELLPEPFDPRPTLDARQAQTPRKERQQAVERYLKALVVTVNETLEEAQRCERISHQVERAPDQMERLDKAEATLNQGIRKLPFVIALTSVEVERARRAGANATSLSESLEASRALYGALKQALLLARPALSEALQRVRRLS